jgi:hypothetical protein
MGKVGQVPRPKSVWGWIRLIWDVLRLWWWLKEVRKYNDAGRMFFRAQRRFSTGRKFCITANGYMGWVPLAAEKNDIFCYFEGCPLPYLIRPCGYEYRLIGDCYLHGLMHGAPPGLDMTEPKSIILI